MIVLALLFASTFLIARFTGVLTVENIEAWLTAAKSLSPVYVAIIVITLLFADLFIAVPTLTISILSGFFLGQFIGSAAAVTGMMLAGTIGYILSYAYGERLVALLIKDEQQRQEARDTFQKHGIIMILLARAVPILPEVTACMAGATRMRFSTFILAWSVSSVPYAMIAAYAGSISTLENPRPAIFTAIGLTAFFWVSWFIFQRLNKKKSEIKAAE